jgi:AmiR/NasT family two-component response regulator
VQDPEEALRVWLIVRRAVEAQEEKQGVSEEDAFRLIEQRSSRDNESLLEAAEAVLAADGVA